MRDAGKYTKSSVAHLALQKLQEEFLDVGEHTVDAINAHRIIWDAQANQAR